MGELDDMSISASLSEPIGHSPLLAAVSWLESTLLGTIALTIATLAIAWVGLMMLAGRVNVRHGVTAVAGCFVLFGAPAIAAGLKAELFGTAGSTPDSGIPETAPVFIPPTASLPVDPYAGASLPPRQ